MFDSIPTFTLVSDGLISNYPNVLTPPMESQDIQMLLSPASDILQLDSNSAMLPDFINMLRDKPYLRIIEEPIDRFRYRYKSETSGSHGCLTGKNSDRMRKVTYPTIELCNFPSDAIIRCSLYQYKQDESDTREPHAHRLVRKELNEEIDDPHDFIVSPEKGFMASFHGMAIIHTARKYLVGELSKKKRKLKLEEVARTEKLPRDLNKQELLYINKFAEEQSKTINLNIVCLRFDAFQMRDNVLHPLCPSVYSNPINNLKSAQTGDLKIVRMDHCSSPAKGGRDIFIFVEKVTKKNIKIRFFEIGDDGEAEVWEDYGRFSDYDVHHQFAIAFKTPPYKNLNIDKEVAVFMELLRPSDGARSEPREFKYTPVQVAIGRKRMRQEPSSYSSSNYSSSELPATINLDRYQVNSEDLEKAIRNKNINSVEFQNFCEEILKEPSMVHEMYNVVHEDVQPFPDFGVNVLRTDGQDSKNKTQGTLSKIQSQLTAFMMTNPSKDKISKMMESLIRKEYMFYKQNTFLHILCTDPEDKFLLQILDLLVLNQLPEVTNIQNSEGMTPLHIAIINKNLKAVEKLIFVKCDPSIKDLDGNTPLHLAITNNVPVEILRYLLQPMCNTDEFIELENNDGYTALHVAIKSNNLHLVELLLASGAQVNRPHKSNGYTPLHMAVCEQNSEVVELLLKHPDMVVNRIDFSGTNALLLAEQYVQEGLLEAKEIYDLVMEYMLKIDQSIGMKLEIVDIEMEDSKKWLYNEEVEFKEDVLLEVAKLLDRSGNWKELAKRLDYGHLLKTDLFSNSKSPSETLLKYSIDRDNIFVIRNILDQLQEKEAVRIIDKTIDPTYTD